MSNLRSVFSRARERGKDPFDIYFLGHMCSGEILHTEQEGVFETTYPLFTHAYIVPPKTMRIIASTKWPKTGVSDGGKEGYWSVDQNIDQWFAQTFYAGGKLVLGQVRERGLACTFDLVTEDSDVKGNPPSPRLASHRSP